MLISLHAVYARYNTAQGTMLTVLDQLGIEPVEQRVVGKSIRRMYDMEVIDANAPKIVAGVRAIQQAHRLSLSQRAKERQPQAVQQTPSNAIARIERKLDLLLHEVESIKQHLGLGE